MKLKSMELIGFKSFAQKTKIDFPDGLTEIVGPNGSGKSNVIEAIRWALGEQSVKKLRSSKMADVIFSGSRGHPALDRARVTLEFDNHDHFVDSDYDEVRVSRKLYRDGSSYYYLNGKECRLLDIQNLFMNSGIGSGSFSIISQGQVQQIFKSKPEDRRFIIETAAGIYRYKAQKHTAKQKLTNTDHNVTRIRDRVNDLKSRLNHLSSQKRQAQTYLRYQKILTHLQIQQLLFNYQRLQKSDAQTERQAQRLHRQMIQLRNQTKAIQQQKQRHQVQSQQWHARSNQLQERLLKITRQLDAFNNQKKLVHQQLIFQQQTIHKDQQQMTRLTAADQQKENRQHHYRTMVKKDRQTIQRLQKTVDQFNGTRSQQAIEKKRDQIDHLQNQYVQLTRRSARITNQIQNDHQSQQNFSDRRLGLQRHLEQITRSYRDARQREEQCEQEVERLRQRSAGIQRSIDQQNRKVKSQRTAFARQTALFRQQERKIQGLAAQRDGLSRLMINHTNLHRGERNLLDHAQQIPGIMGPVAKFIKVPPQYIKAVETTLRSQLQHIIVRDHQVAQRAIRFLNQNRLGRVTLLPVHEVAKRWLNPQVLQTCQRLPGFIGVAAHLVQMPQSMSRIQDHLLENVLVARDLSAAVQLGRLIHHRYRIVTLNGEVVNAGGAITGGRNRYDYHGILSQRYQLDRIKKTLDSKNKAAELARRQIASAKQNGQRSVQILENRQQRLNQVQQDLAVKRTEQKHLISDVQQQKRQQKTVQRSMTDLKSSQQDSHAQDRLRKIQKQVRSQLSQNRAQIQDLKKQVQIQSQQINQQDIKYQQQREALIRSQNHSAMLDDRLKALRQSLVHNQGIVKQLKANVDHAQRQIWQLQHRQRAGQKGTLSQKTIEKIHEQRADLKKKLQRLDRQLEQTSQQIYHGRNQQIQLRARLSQIQLVHNQRTHQIKRIEQILKMQYHVAIAKLKPIRLTKKELISRINRIKDQMQAMGAVNLRAIDEFSQVQKRHGFLHQQLVDLLNSRQQLLDAMNRMNQTIKERFKRTFDRVNQMFKQTYSQIFKGGKAHLQLTDPKHLLTTGINIMAQPPGKRYRSMELLSGGERALTAIALLFAVIRIRPVPFCILDEAESALDLVNVSRFAQYISRLKQKTQFIVITHRKETMLFADHLYGITMQHSGISTVISVNLDQAKAEG